MLSKQLVIDGWNKGMKVSPFDGFSQMRGIDPFKVRGAASVRKQSVKVTHTPVATQNFTADSGTSQLTVTNAIEDYAPVTVSNSGGALPTGLAVSTVYYVKKINATTIKLATTYLNVTANSFITLSNNGTGTHSIVTVDMETPKWTTTDKTGNTFVLDSNGRLWKKISGYPYTIIFGLITGNTLGSGNGLTYWKDYVLVSRTSTTTLYLDCYNIATGAWTVLTYTGCNVSGTVINPIFVSQGDVVFISGGRYINSLTENTGQVFDPASGATFTQSTSADFPLKFPQDYTITCFAELGSMLYSGTKFGTGSNKIADLFPWDEDADNSFSTPIRIADDGINSMITKDNLIYMSTGRKGRMYVTNGSSVTQIPGIPLDYKDGTGTYIDVQYDALETLGDTFLIGIDNTSSGSSTMTPIGVFEINPKENSSVYIGNLSLGDDGTLDQIKIGTVYSVNPETYYIGWTSGSSSGVDIVNPFNSQISSYGAYVDSEMFVIPLGKDRTPESSEHIDIYLARELATGQGIKIKYRTSINDSFEDTDHTLVTFDYATHGAVNFCSFDVGINDIHTIQFRVELTTTSTTTPELRAVIIQ